MFICTRMSGHITAIIQRHYIIFWDSRHREKKRQNKYLFPSPKRQHRTCDVQKKGLLLFFFFFYLFMVES